MTFIRLGAVALLVAVSLGCRGAGKTSDGPKPLIAAAPPSLSFTAQVGDADSAQTITVSNAGGATLGAMTTGTDVGWLSPSIVGSTVMVTASLGALSAGTYQGTISIASAGATNSPLSIPVTLTVSAPAGGTSTIAGASVAIVDAYIAKEQSCKKESDYYLASLRAQLNQRYASYAVAVSAARATYVKSQAEACIVTIDAATCLEWNAVVGTGACTLWVAGAVANGGTCYGTTECANGWCNETGGCPGVCTAFTAHGASCTTYSKECGPGYTCDNGASSPTCVADTLGALGQPCGLAAGPVEPTAGCQTGLYCSAAKTCEAQVSAGESCPRGPNSCQAGLTCDFSTGFTCEPLAGAGESCANAACGLYLYCSANGSICKALALAGQDCTEPASRFDNALRCVDGSFCLGGTIRTCTNGTAAEHQSCEPNPTVSTSPSLICSPNTYCWTPPVGPSLCLAKPPVNATACYQ
jgi:hypothetical protein